MKKLILKSFILLSTTSIVFTGCSTNQQILPKETKKGYVNQELDGAPSWVKVPKVKGFVSEIGTSPKILGNNFGYQREEAIANARSNIVRQIGVKVNTMFQLFQGTTGSEKNATVDKSSQTVTNQIATAVLKGSIVKDLWISRSDTLYVLMIVDTNMIEDAMKKAIKTSYKNNDAVYQRFLASQAQGQLAIELEKLNIKNVKK